MATDEDFEENGESEFRVCGTWSKVAAPIVNCGGKVETNWKTKVVDLSDIYFHQGYYMGDGKKTATMRQRGGGERGGKN